LIYAKLSKYIAEMGKSSVLLVEDRDDVRDLVTALLQEAGYRVLPAINGDIALVLLDQADLPIDLLLTDVVMPGEYDGFALAHEAVKRRPGLRVVYMTGHFEVAKIRAQGAPYGDVVKKPWRNGDLLRAVDAALRTPWAAGLPAAPPVAPLG
jgi:DNA-binding NtrC family response regulator